MPLLTTWRKRSNRTMKNRRSAKRAVPTLPCSKAEKPSLSRSTSSRAATPSTASSATVRADRRTPSRAWSTNSRSNSGSLRLGQVLAEALDRLRDPLVRGGEGDSEEALATRPVHRAGRDDDRGLLEDELRERGRGVALGDGRPDVDRALRGLDV